MRVLVTGGVRSGKSAHAEGLLAHAPSVTYVATGSADDDDTDWKARVSAHQERRPVGWTTVETTDLAGTFAAVASGPVLVDSLGTWLAARLDWYDAWNAPRGDWESRLETEIGAVVAAVPEEIVLVSDEIGLGGVAADRGVRLFADLLGTLNQQMAANCDEVHLVVAGRVIRL